MTATRSEFSEAFKFILFNLLIEVAVGANMQKDRRSLKTWYVLPSLVLSLPIKRNTPGEAAKMCRSNALTPNMTGL
jgi:hypothetical protein